MTPFYDFFAWLSGRMDVAPGNYGWFHILWILIVIGATILLCHFFKDANDKTYRRIIWITWVVIVLFECYKELIYTFHEAEPLANSTWKYQWYAFPFQFCSTPLYVMPFVAFLPDNNKVTKWIRRACMFYTATFAFFGGFVVYVYPNDVFTKTIGIDIQTMVHHGSQVVIGIYTAVYMRKDYKMKDAWSAIAVFAFLSLVAIVLNETVGLYVKGIGETFNMFFISRHFPCTLPVLSSIYPAVPYFLFLLLYLLGFSLAASIVYFSELGIMKLVSSKREKDVASSDGEN